jgi:hypothetical protein
VCRIASDDLDSSPDGFTSDIGDENIIRLTSFGGEIQEVALIGVGSKEKTFQRLSDGSGYQYANPSPARDNNFGMYQHLAWLDCVLLCFKAVLRANYLAHSKSHAMLALFSLFFNCCIVRFHPLSSHGCRE